MDYVITGARTLLPQGLVDDVMVQVENGWIAAIEPMGPVAPQGQVIDAKGRLLLPGLVDLHGDAFERQILPRPGVEIGADIALHDTDRQLLANGITTAYHAVTLSWEPGLRSETTAVRLLSEIQRLTPHLSCDTRIHLRFELLALEARQTVLDWLGSGAIGLLSFNEHASQMAAKGLDNPGKLVRYQERTGLAPEAFATLVRERLARRAEADALVRALSDAALAANVPMASHDDDSSEMRKAFRERGATVSEFPVDEVTASEAIASGDAVMLGAPNVIRGGSHAGRLSAGDAVAQGCCTLLASDYYYPALLHAPFALVSEGACDLETAWRLVSTNPAQAVGLGDRGTIAKGYRADLVLVVPPGTQPARVDASFVAGRLVHHSGALSCGAVAHS